MSIDDPYDCIGSEVKCKLLFIRGHDYMKLDGHYRRMVHYSCVDYSMLFLVIRSINIEPNPFSNSYSIYTSLLSVESTTYYRLTLVYNFIFCISTICDFSKWELLLH